jgi:hypothetical protein
VVTLEEQSIWLDDAVQVLQRREADRGFRAGGDTWHFATDNGCFGIGRPAIGAIDSFSRSLAREVAPAIRVNILAPGFIETAFGEEADSTWRDEVVARTPLARWGVPEDVAHAAVFLASEAAGFLTGQTLTVNGGVVM